MGWAEIIEEALDALSRMDVVVPLIREKAGALQIQAWPRGAWRPEEFKESGLIKSRARARSAETCELCGQPGRIRSRTMTCRCEEHQAVR
jgi:hypothetical protein